MGAGPRRWVGLVLALAAAACATAERDLAGPGMPLPRGVRLSVVESPYPVTGTTEEEIGRSLREGGPGAFFGSFEWDMRSRWQWSSTPRGCVMREVEITVLARLVMPDWADRTGAPAEVRGSWDRFREALRGHERGHYENVARAARALHRELMRLEVQNCAFMRAAARDLHERTLRRWKDVDRTYDEETQHGRTQGAVWPPARGRPEEGAGAPTGPGSPDRAGARAPSSRSLAGAPENPVLTGRTLT